MNSNSGKENEYTVHIVSHTHWDREWYLTFQQFRVRLVDLIDNLLEVLKEKPQYEFTLDGQTIVLEDYLDVKPDRKEELKKIIEEGNVNIGPWYVLPDEFLVSGESIVRNFLKGMKVSREFGEPMKIGYIPDMFGHISQMPAILDGFGLENALLWRGVGERIEDSQFLWKGDDGSETLTTFLYEGYCNLASIPEKKGEAGNFIREVLQREKQRAVTDEIILMNGCDHLEAQPHVPDIIDRLNEEFTDVELKHSNLRDFTNSLKEAVEEEDPELSEVNGELRRSTDRGEIFPGTLSTRSYLKTRNSKLETLLEKWVEPFSTISAIFEGQNHKKLVDKAWEYLLKNQTHDGICGCSIDEVHDQMLTRYDWAEEICDEILSKAFDSLAREINNEKISNADYMLVVFNSEDQPYSGSVKTEIELNTPFEGIKREDLGIEHEVEDEVEDFELKDGDGNILPYQVLDEKTEINIEPEPDRLAKRVDKKVFDVSFPVKDIPPTGFKVYGLYFTGKDEKNIYSHAEEKGIPGLTGRVQVNRKNNTMENDYLRVSIGDDGALVVKDKKRGSEFSGWNKFEDMGDAGDEYNYSRPKIDEVVHSGAHSVTNVELVHAGPIIASYKVEHKLEVPESLSEDRVKRSSQKNHCRISSLVSLGIDKPYVEINTTVDNKAKDHRLRSLFSLGKEVEFSHAEGAFTVNKRSIHKEYEDSEIESEVTTYPQKSFVDISTGESGLAVFNKGLQEYEVIENDTIALTLLRSVGWLANDDFLSRNSTIGSLRKLPTPGAQCLGEYEFSYAVMPHGGSWKKSNIHKYAHEFSSGRIISHQDNQVPPEGGSLPGSFSFVEVKPESLNLSSLKTVEDEEGFILRIYNITDDEVSGEITINKNLSEVYCSNMAEEKVEELEVKAGTIKQTFAPHEIKTWRLQTE